MITIDVGDWPAPTARGPIDAVVEIPGSKSITNRALLLGALAQDSTVIRGGLRARDTELMMGALRALGVTISSAADGWIVEPAALRGPADIDCGLAGTVTRFVLAAAPLATGTVRLDGEPRNRQRPLRPLIEALRELGAEISDDGSGRLPVTVHGSGGLPGGRCDLDASASSQFISALLLVGPRTDRGVTVRHVGTNLPSLPHIAMTVQMLRDRGVVVDETEPATWRVEPGAISGGVIDVEPDLSNAAPFLAAALVTGGRVTVPRWPRATTQPGDELRSLLTAMGGRCEWTEHGLTVTASGSIRGVDLDVRHASELVPTLVGLAALADSPSRLRGIGHMRGHETDRLAALATEINRLGGKVTELPDGLEIHPRPLRGARFRTYGDHRMATTGALLGLAVPGIVVEDIGTVAKTLPTFTTLWTAMLGGV